MTDEEQKPESGRVLKTCVYIQTYPATFYINLRELLYIFHILLDMKWVHLETKFVPDGVSFSLV